MIIVWGRRNSANVQKVMWLIGELNLSYRRHPFGGSFEALDTKEYKNLNPNCTIPVITDGDLLLWQSNVIVRYLAQKYSEGELWPNEIQIRALADQWMEWQQTVAGLDSFIVFHGLIKTPPEKQNRAVIEAAAKRLGQTYQILDQHLCSNNFVAGKNFSMGDIPLGVNLNRYYNLNIERPELPNVKKWFDRIQQKPAFQKHVGFPFGNDLDEWLKLEKEGQ